MNVKDKVYTEFIGLRLTKEEYDLLYRTLCRKKNDKLSAKLREYIFTKIKEEPVLEYSMIQKDGKMGVILYEKDIETDPLFYDNIGAAMRYIKSVGAIKKAA